ncbi:OmpP1/FadL family transporter [Candidatus Paracaedibacter symbiosus]|uniref:OmpP1/FadL family transporter n=1 Tax=Candidatus Paracaedibacter symbiosus TaxID=244582 RepID=UPI000509EF5C|nr:outer membrane protein transport protein [Candidatus Paracaedibacter symbiosus]
MRSLLLLSSVLSLGVAATSTANASGFGVKVNSTVLQGQANAGSAVINDPLAMYNNPAILSQIGAKGGRFEAALSGTGILGNVKYTNLNTGLNTGNIVKNKFTGTGAAAFAAKIHPCATVGLAITTPYGLAFNYGRNSDVKNYVVESDLKTVAFSPSLAIKVNPMLTLGAGMDVQWSYVKFSSYPVLSLPTTFGTAKGNDWLVRGTFGVLVEPTQDIRFGVSIKTRSTARLSGDFVVENPYPSANLVNGPASAKVSFPTTITLSGSYNATSKWTIYGDFIRTNWSSISSVIVNTPAPPSQIVGGWEDTNFISIGTDYKFNDKWTVRGGLGFDYTPTAKANRVPGIPDNNKTWLAVGGSYEVNSWKFSLSYGHEFFKNAPVQQTASSLNGVPAKPALNGKIKEHADLISIQVNYKF